MVEKDEGELRMMRTRRPRWQMAQGKASGHSVKISEGPQGGPSRKLSEGLRALGEDPRRPSGWALEEVLRVPSGGPR
eukprot:7827802-Pyramimonas_sp.AAC.1